MTRHALFPYSGSKARDVQHLPAPPKGTVTIVEPFAGSLAYSVAHRVPNIICAEASELARDLLLYLNKSTYHRLHTIQALRIQRVQIAQFGERHGLTEPEQTLVRLFTAGAISGALNSKILYPNKRLALDFKSLAYFRHTNLQVHKDFRDLLAPDSFAGVDPESTWYFVDPPYLDTVAGYDKGCGGMSPSEVMALIEGKRGILTYHEPSTFPGLNWKVARQRTVGNPHGGTTDRTEWYAVFG